MYAAIAHDLKTPMTSVQGFAKALSDGKIKTEEQQEIFDIIYRKSNSMNEMVDTLFDYAKLGTDEYKPTFVQTDICALVRDIVAENYCELKDHGTRLDIDIPDTAITINADKTELKRAVTNLIVNIFKHNPDGISAKISVAEEGRKAVIRIADSGDPLPDGVDIFKPFVTENTARTVGQGTGLGLAVTKRVIESHGGTIGVETTVPGYTKMFVHIISRITLLVKQKMVKHNITKAHIQFMKYLYFPLTFANNNSIIISNHDLLNQDLIN